MSDDDNVAATPEQLSELAATASSRTTQRQPRQPQGDRPRRPRPKLSELPLASARLAVDAPNIDMALVDLHGGIHLDTSYRPDWDVLNKWITRDARKRLTGHNVTQACCVFVNVEQPLPDPVRGWLRALGTMGYRVFAKPRHKNGDGEKSDIDDDLIAWICEDGVDLVYVACHDMENCRKPLRRLAKNGTKVVLLGFTEKMGRYKPHANIELVDLRDIPGLFKNLPPRIDWNMLPEEGTFLS